MLFKVHGSRDALSGGLLKPAMQQCGGYAQGQVHFPGDETHRGWSGRVHGADDLRVQWSREAVLAECAGAMQQDEKKIGVIRVRFDLYRCTVVQRVHRDLADAGAAVAEGHLGPSCRGYYRVWPQEPGQVITGREQVSGFQHQLARQWHAGRRHGPRAAKGLVCNVVHSGLDAAGLLPLTQGILARSRRVWSAPAASANAAAQTV